MTFEEFKKGYYTPKVLKMCDRYALVDFVYDHSDDKNYKVVFHSLLRNGISSLDDFRNTSIEEIKNLRNIGTKRMNMILEMKKVLDSLE